MKAPNRLASNTSHELFALAFLAYLAVQPLSPIFVVRSQLTPLTQPSLRARVEGEALERDREPRVPLALHAGLQIFRPYSCAKLLVELLNRYPGEPRVNSFSWQSYEHYRDHNHVFSEHLGVLPTQRTQ